MTKAPAVESVPLDSREKPMTQFSADALVQAQAGRDLRTHSEGVIDAVNQLKRISAELPSGLQGQALTAGLSVHDVLHSDVIKHATRLAQHGDHFVNSANVQSAGDVDGNKAIAQVIGGAVASTINTSV
ncbi:MAG TPA: hypothetical protein VGL21_11440 [Jatrophihabitantaceae bacterium]